MKNYTRFQVSNKGKAITTFIGVSPLPIKSYERTVVCIKDKDKVYKIISVNSNKRDGSIIASFNYCKEKNAFIFQHRHKYKAGLQKIDESQITKKFTVDKNAKLSIHRSGFVQLSGKGILSGIDKKTRKPKGIGVFSSPLDRPVSSGPTLLFQCWGLDNNFEQLTRRKAGVQYIILDKDKNDFTERKIIKNKKFSTYVLEFFIFPKEANRFIYDYKGEPFINHIIDNYLFSPGSLFAHPVLDLKYFNEVICVFPVLMWIQSNKKSKHEWGYTLSSPGGSDCAFDKSKTGNNFHLVCPREASYSMTKFVDRLEYKNKKTNP